MLPEPMFREPLHVGRPNLGDTDRMLALLSDAIDRRVLSNNGPLVRELEGRVAEIAGTKHAIATSSAFVGIQIAARVAGIMPGDEVIVPAWTWVATPYALSWCGITPVFCDVDEQSGTADPEHLERLIGPKTKGILAVHVFGYPCHVEALTDVAERHGIPLLFDSAHGIGSTYKGKPIGGFGTAEVFSFHATKFINSFEGGAIVSDDDDFVARARPMINLGLDANREHVSIGTNGRMSEAAAAMGLVNLDIIDDLVEVNRANHERYGAEIADIPGVKLRSGQPGDRLNNQYVVIEIDESVAGIHRDTVHDELYRNNVFTRRYFHPGCHMVDPYVDNPAVHTPLPVPVTEKLAARVLSLPTGTSIGEPEVAGICQIIRELVRGSRSRAA